MQFAEVNVISHALIKDLELESIPGGHFYTSPHCDPPATPCRIFKTLVIVNNSLMKIKVGRISSDMCISNVLSTSISFTVLLHRVFLFLFQQLINLNNTRAAVGII